MNTTAPTSPSSHSAPAAGHTQGTRGPGKPGQGAAGPADQFAHLLLLLNAGNERPADALAPALDASDEPATADAPSVLPQDNSAQHPLAGLLGWPGLPLQTETAVGGLNGRTTTGPTLDALSPSTTATATALASAERADGLPPTTAPETLDADTLAALARANTPAEPAAGDAARGAAPVRITAWRSTAGLAPQAAGLAAAQAVSGAPSVHASVSQATFAQATVARTSGADAALAPTVRSTVQLDERFAPAGSDNASTSPTATGSTSGTAGTRQEALPGAAGAGGAGGGTGQDASPDLSQGFSAPGEDAAASDAAAQAAAEADEGASAGWGAQHLRHASVRVGEPGEQAIDIQLSMAGQEVRVEFRTDDAQTRASLAQDGGASLGELLQRSGIDLGGVSVGAQGQQAGQDQPARAPQGQAMPATQRGREADAPAASAAQPPRPRADGSRPLDLFV